MATEKIRVGMIVRNGWGSEAHIPALRTLPEFEITASAPAARNTLTDRPSMQVGL